MASSFMFLVRLPSSNLTVYTDHLLGLIWNQVTFSQDSSYKPGDCLETRDAPNSLRNQTKPVIMSFLGLQHVPAEANAQRRKFNNSGLTF